MSPMFQRLNMNHNILLMIDLKTFINNNYISIYMEKLHKSVLNYHTFSKKGTELVKLLTECMHLSKPCNVRYSIRLIVNPWRNPKHVPYT